jgi:hypothetical protein
MMPHHGGKEGLLIAGNLKWLIKRVFDICRGKIFHELLDIDFFAIVLFLSNLCVYVPFGVDRFMNLKPKRGFYMPQQFSLHINDFFLGYLMRKDKFSFLSLLFFLPLSYVNRERNSSCNLYCLCEHFWRWYFTFRITLLELELKFIILII